MNEMKKTGSLIIDRRRLLTLTAAGVSVAAFGGFATSRAFAADAIRWVSPRGTLEVLDDYPYWVAKKFGYFG
ncbi:MAG: ABC transporter substrate-binding protein, partial [Bauldia sp.]|nr:ABC transporter substrate-binding protein [Bauldia sp.]